ncbi:uncharacterized protein TRAVEDRAFT_52857 [Trametes versicolor FP-101664 SS1]|uniref:uncharacterized protein n=1 Tax=Trametes versicolor (strain FP-101664) TaxID=717944 RepID=UPI0004622632|nr:uncharacterized protein TRAVEDRAFT_52857 [Trametes versicolor FP-101664 SS1]EIW53733.1 hypothetical protein TRAVEDRAFT_52857 [Trametes versicolor FP-101664 SS1]
MSSQARIEILADAWNPGPGKAAILYLQLRVVDDEARFFSHVSLPSSIGFLCSATYYAQARAAFRMDTSGALGLLSIRQRELLADLARALEMYAQPTALPSTSVSDWDTFFARLSDSAATHREHLRGDVEHTEALQMLSQWVRERHPDWFAEL